MYKRVPDKLLEAVVSAVGTIVEIEGMDLEKLVEKVKKKYPNEPAAFWEGKIEGMLATMSALTSAVHHIDKDEMVAFMAYKACVAKVVLESRKELKNLEEMGGDKA